METRVLNGYSLLNTLGRGFQVCEFRRGKMLAEISSPFFLDSFAARKVTVRVRARRVLQGKVYRARTADGEIVALKCIPRDVILRDRRRFENMERELTAMQRVRTHPNAVRIIGVDYDVFKPRKGGKPGGVNFVVIAMEYAAGGELMSYMEISPFPERVARTYFNQLTEMLSYATSLFIAHRDIKPENLLLDDSFGLKVADWGLSAVADTAAGNAHLMTTCGTVSHVNAFCSCVCRHAGAQESGEGETTPGITFSTPPPFLIYSINTWRQRC